MRLMMIKFISFFSVGVFILFFMGEVHCMEKEDVFPCNTLHKRNIHKQSNEGWQNDSQAEEYVETQKLFGTETSSDKQNPVHAAKLNNLGVKYMWGSEGVQYSYKKAFKYYKQAAELGSVNGQYNLGFCYQYGYGCDKSLKQASWWYKLAADRGHMKAKKKLKSINEPGICIIF